MDIAERKLPGTTREHRYGGKNLKLTVRFPVLFEPCPCLLSILRVGATLQYISSPYSMPGPGHAKKARGSLHLRCQRAPINDCGNAPSCQHPLGSHRPTTCQVDGNLEAYTIQRFPAVPLVWAVLTSASFCCTGWILGRSAHTITSCSAWCAFILRAHL